MTNTNVTAGRLAELGGASNSGLKIGFIDSAAKAAQNDTWTVKNAKEVIWAVTTLDSTGVEETNTVATNVITLNKATTTGATSGFVIFK